MSSAMARNISDVLSLLLFVVWVLNFDSLVTPSTSWPPPCRTAPRHPGGVVGVLGNVVEDSGGDCHGIYAEIGEYLRRGQRVSDVRLAVTRCWCRWASSANSYAARSWPVRLR